MLPKFMGVCIGHTNSVDLDHVWCVLLAFKVVILLQTYSSYIHKCLPSIPLLLLYSLYSFRVPWPAFVLPHAHIVPEGP